MKYVPLRLTPWLCSEVPVHSIKVTFFDRHPDLRQEVGSLETAQHVGVMLGGSEDWTLWNNSGIIQTERCLMMVPELHGMPDEYLGAWTYDMSIHPDVSDNGSQNPHKLDG